MATVTHRVLILALLASAPIAGAAAQNPRPPDLASASIEDLLTMEITSVSRKPEQLGGVAAAVYVLTREDIHRSGLSSVPDVLRLVPGVQVAQMNGNKWAVSIRGFNGVYADKLLVLVDGRSVYNRVFSGVLWDAEDLVLEDIDRIEVTRGPGGSLWGANAVNGVINIITVSARDTQGALVRVGAGTGGSSQALARYGGTLRGGSYRVFSQWTDLGASEVTPLVVNDDLRRATAGFRGDWTSGRDTFMFQGRGTAARARELWLNFDPAPVANRPALLDTPTDMTGGMMVGSWTHARTGGASLELQAALDFDHRDEPIADYHGRSLDVSLQYHTAVGRRHDLVAGTGYRLYYERFAGRNGFRLTPQASTEEVVNVFGQDEITMAGDRLHLSLGARADRDGFAGWGVMPNARMTWDVVPNRQHLWFKTARVLRTPSLQERGIRVDFAPIEDPSSPLPIRPTVLGNAGARSLEFADVEAGYRVEIASSATLSVTGFKGHYRHLPTSEPRSPFVQFGPEGPYLSAPVQLENLSNADTRGLEIDGEWAPATWWRLGGAYTAFKLTPHPDAASRDAAAAIFDGTAPAHQWQVQSDVLLGPRGQMNVSLFRVGALRILDVPAYTRADVRFEWRLTGSLSAVAAGQNLLDRSHAEFTGAGVNAATLVSRRLQAQLIWRLARR